jgi:hypothetical protein
VRINHLFDAGSHPNVPAHSQPDREEITTGPPISPEPAPLQLNGDHDGATDLTGAGHRFCSIGASSWRGHRHRNGHVNLIGKNRIQRLGQMRSRSNAILVIPQSARDNAQTLRGNRLPMNSSTICYFDNGKTHHTRHPALRAMLARAAFLQSNPC